MSSCEFDRIMVGKLKKKGHIMTKRTGDARFPSTKYKTSQHCVAYLDFLGGADIILHDDQDKHLNIINMIFEDALNESKMITNDIFVKIFSDNILLAIPTNDGDREQKIGNIINLVSNFVHQSADNGYLIRGAVTEGDFFHNNIIVYGKALVEVVKMEEKFAIYPRVIVQKDIAKCFPQYFYPCADGWDAVNYSVFEMGFDSVNLKHTLLSQLTAKKADEKVKQKIMFAITDFNFINVPMRKIRALSHEIITPEEVKNALK